MPTIPIWLKGRNVSVVMTPQTVDAAGVLSDTTPVRTFTGKLDRVSWRTTPRTEEISAMDMIQEHDEIIKERTEFTITEILKPAGNMIEAAFYVSEVFKVLFTRGTDRAMTFYLRRGSYEETIEAGKCVGVGTLTMLSLGATLNPTTTGT